MHVPPRCLPHARGTQGPTAQRSSLLALFHVDSVVLPDCGGHRKASCARTLGYKEASFRPSTAQADVLSEQVSMPVPGPCAPAPRGGVSGAQPCPGPHLGLHLSLSCVPHTLHT